MKNFLYVGGPTITGATLRDGASILLRKGKCYELDETNEYVQTLLAKRDSRGFPAPWLQEVANVPVSAVNSVQHIAESGDEPEEIEETVEKSNFTTNKRRR